MAGGMTDERMIVPGYLKTLSEAATPGPWIRKWESLDVHHMGSGPDGPYALRFPDDIDFAVACVSFVRELLDSEVPA